MIFGKALSTVSRSLGLAAPPRAAAAEYWFTTRALRWACLTAGTFLSLQAHAAIILKTRLTSAVIGVTASRDASGSINTNDTKNFTADFLAKTLVAAKSITGDGASSSGEAAGSGQLTLDNSRDSLDLSGSCTSSASANATSEPGHARVSQANTTGHGMIVSFELTGHSYTYTVTGHVSATGSSEFFVSRGEGGVTISSDGGNQTIFDARARITETQNAESKDFSGSGTLAPGRWRISISSGSIATAGSNNLPSGHSSASADCVFKLTPVNTPGTEDRFYWVGPPAWPLNTAPGGSFGTAQFWDPQDVPQKTLTRSDVAVFNRSEAYSVNIGSRVNERLLVMGGNVSFSDAEYTLAALDPANPSVVISNARLTLGTGNDASALKSIHATIGELAPARFDVRHGASWRNSGLLKIGEGGDGLLRIEAGGFVSNAESDLSAGSSHGDAVITGSGARWTTGALAVGHTGPGSMIVEDGALVEALLAWLALTPAVQAASL